MPSSKEIRLKQQRKRREAPNDEAPYMVLSSGQRHKRNSSLVEVPSKYKTHSSLYIEVYPQRNRKLAEGLIRDKD